MRAKEFVLSKKNVHPTKASLVPKYVLGPEVEHTAAYGKKTLIVNFPTALEEICAAADEYDCEHIYFELSRLLKHTEGSTRDRPELIKKYRAYARKLLKKGFWVTMDSPNNFAERFADLTANKKFVINMAVIVPGIEKLKGNVSVKVMGGGWKNGSEGIYCIDLKQIKQRKHLTPWKAYKVDQRIDIK